MKIINIPTHNNPFTVIINNREYTYKGGETIEAPDEVAEAIEDALELVPKPKRYLGKFSQFVEGSITELTASDLSEVETIAYYAFGHSYSLTSIEIPNSIKSIGDSAFAGCNALKSIKFESNSKLESIGAGAFEWCWKLESIYLPEVPPTLANANVFASITPTCTFYCKTQASLDAYKAAQNWSTLTGTYSFVVEE